MNFFFRGKFIVNTGIQDVKHLSFTGHFKLLNIYMLFAGWEVRMVTLKCYYDQILDTHFFTLSHTTGLSKISCQISIYYEQYNSCFLGLYFREFTTAINFSLFQVWVEN